MSKQDSIGDGIRWLSRSHYQSIKKTAEIFDTSERTIYRQLARGDLEAVRLGGSTKVTDESIERRIASLPRFVSRSRDAKA